MSRLLWWLALLVCLGLVRLSHAADEYHGITNSVGYPCCGPYDCRAYSHEEVRFTSGSMELLVDGKWLLVDDEATSPTPSWDGQLHACVTRYAVPGAYPVLTRPRVVCVIMPGVA